MEEKKITQVTVREMCEALQKAINEGHGDKYLVAPSDNEGNSYHGVFYHLSPVKEELDNLYDSQVSDIDKIMIIG